MVEINIYAIYNHSKNCNWESTTHAWVSNVSVVKIYMMKIYFVHSDRLKWIWNSLIYLAKRQNFDFDIPSTIRKFCNQNDSPIKMIRAEKGVITSLRHRLVNEEQIMTGYPIDGAMGSSGGGRVRKLSVVCLHTTTLLLQEASWLLYCFVRHRTLPQCHLYC